MTDRALPRISELGVVALVLCAISVITIAGSVPQRPPMAIVWALIGLAGAAMVVAVASLARTPLFAWSSFFLVGKWALLGYLVIAGMIEYAFVYDHTPEPQMAALSTVLLLFALDVPLLLGFAVARHQPAG